MNDSCDDKHPDHSKELANLSRVAGQIEGVKKMISERQYCPDILTQLRAARSAMKSVEAKILEAHLGACVEEAFASKNVVLQKQKIDELKEIFKRFED
ncbi:MAG: hypothetical protein COV36_02175 [Alphaproteobacteria bacterium CG11_big_fil_rev_8_21_14_0_20_44_7]|nr:MAG: hypothetical protein COV36_02175 [Alphaproteobacteria bacterium CG11_big_fil_rev_8_21_14_0_20_44_7]